MFSMFKKDSADAVKVNELDKLIGQIDLIDIREPYEFAEGHLETARNIPMNEIMTYPDKYLDKNKKSYLICQAGVRSGLAVNILKEAGYQVIDVSDGMGAYTGNHRIK